MANHDSVSSNEWDEEDLSTNFEDLEEEGFTATMGGGELEDVPGYDADAAFTEGLPDFNEDEDIELEELPPPCVDDDGPQTESICDKDDRVQIKNTTYIPWRMICVLIITWANGKKSRCTGWFFGQRAVMTAGHCVYNHANGGWAKNILVIPGMKDRTTRPFGFQTATSFRSVKGWIKDKNRTEDYGCIILPNNTLGKRVGWFGFSALSNSSLKNLLVSNCGYPSDKPFGQWYHAGRITRVTTKQIFYKIDTYGGQSGGPVWRRVNGRHSAVGIHAYGGCPNKATRITTAVYNNMQRWKKI